MKNVLLKSLVIFIVMSLLNVQFAEWTIGFLHLPGGSYGMLPILMLLYCLIITVIGLVTVIIFKKSYQSIFKISVLFEILYLFILIISGVNPFRYFLDSDDAGLMELFLFINSLIIFLLIYLFDLLYSKIIFSKSKN